MQLTEVRKFHNYLIVIVLAGLHLNSHFPIQPIIISQSKFPIFWSDIIIYDCASKSQAYFNFKFYCMLMFNRSFVNWLVPTSNTICYLGRTRTKELKVLLVLLIRWLKNYKLNKPLLKIFKSKKTDFCMHSHICVKYSFTL